MRMLISAALIALPVFAASTANAASTQEQIAMCADALDERGVAARGDYKPRFKSISGGGAKKLVLEMEPTVEGDESVVAVCKIKRGKVTEVMVKA